VLVRSEALAKQVGEILEHDRGISRLVDQRDEYFSSSRNHPSCWTMELGYNFA
jgi:hypothetical protein